jgi:hypothetical protein
MNLAVTLARVELYRQVALLGAEIEGEFFMRGSLMKMTRTKEERDASEAKAAEQRLHQMVSDVVTNNSYRLQVGKTRELAWHS